MSQAPSIMLDIGELGVAGLSQTDALQLGAALERELRLRLGAVQGLGGVHGLGGDGPLLLDRLSLSLPQRGTPEAMAAGIASQLASAIATPANSGANPFRSAGGRQS